MIFLDTRTISVIFLLQALTLGLIFIHYSSTKKSLAGTFSLGMSIIFGAISLGLVSLQGIAHDFYSIVLANFLLFIGICLIPYGFRNLFGLKNTNEKFYITLSILSGICIFYFTIITDRPAIRLNFTSLIYAAIFFETFYITWRKSPAAILPVKIPVSCIFFTMGLFFLARLLSIIINPELFNHSLNTYVTGAQKNFTLVSMFFAIIAMLCIYTFFIVMTNLILENENEKSAELARSYAKELEGKNSALNKFFSIISHDLRSPLGAMMEMLKHIATRNEVAGGLGEDIKVLRETSENTYRLLNSLLDWAKTQTKNIEYMPENINISSLINESARQFELMAANKKLDIFKEIDQSLYVRADLKMLSTIIRNIFSNAIKFTRPGGSITIAATIKDGRSLISLTDTGVGMTAEKLSEIFKIDQSTAGYDSDGNIGSGLGLIICKEFAEFNHGIIKAESEPGKGTTMTVALPAGTNS